MSPGTLPPPGLQPSLDQDQSLSIAPTDYSLLTDLYQLTMAACYQQEGIDQRPASFELTVRRLPEGFTYLVAMGLAQVVDYLQNLQFTSEQIAYLQASGIFAHIPDSFWDLLAQAQFQGDLWAVPEGTIVFAQEPLLRIEAQLWQAQLVETFVLNTINYQTLVATRSARLRELVGPDIALLEFGTRRAFSPQASVWAARAALAAGFNATSNVLAAAKLGVKPVGTMAHALVMALAATTGSEAAAFQAFDRSFPHAPLLIDTYDTIAAARQLAKMQRSGEMQIGGVRIDSGDLALLSQQVRQLLPGVPIYASGDVDEQIILDLQAAGACVDGYGIGTKLVTGQPVNGVYKLVELDGLPVMKESSGKITYPGRKQIYRYLENSVFQSDELGLIDQPAPVGQPLLQPILKAGRAIADPEPLSTIAARSRTQVASLPPNLRRSSTLEPSPVRFSTALLSLTERTRHHHEA